MNLLKDSEFQAWNFQDAAWFARLAGRANRGASPRALYRALARSAAFRCARKDYRRRAFQIAREAGE